MYLYAFLALFWSALGVTILAWHRLDPNALFFKNFGSAFVAGWVAIALGVYNLVRWWSASSARRYEQEMSRLRERDKKSEAGKSEPPDAAFDFDSPQGQAKGEE